MTVFEREVTIVGAGPSGALCAAYLAKAGIDVLLLERDIFPREKACGDVLREGFVSHVEALGIAGDLDTMSTCVRRLKLISDDGHTTTIPFECYCAPRRDVDSLLVDTAISLGAEVKQGCTVTDVLTEQGIVRGVKAVYRGEEISVRSRLTIGADGAFSTLAAAAGVVKEEAGSMWIGRRAYFTGVRLDRALAKGQYDAYGVIGFSSLLGTGYFWIIPVGKEGVRHGICNVGMLINGREEYESVDIERCFSRWLESRPEMAAMFEGASIISPWQGGRISDMSCGIHKAGHGFMVIGDAAALMTPLSHDGLSPAADSAKAAAEAATDALAAGDFSQNMLISSYGKHFRTKGEKALSEEMKEKRLLMESMRDPGTMNRIVELLESDQVFRRKHLK